MDLAYQWSDLSIAVSNDYTKKDKGNKIEDDFTSILFHSSTRKSITVTTNLSLINHLIGIKNVGSSEIL
jgi:hypothetical protein